MNTYKYELRNTMVLYSLEEWFTKNRTSGAISLETAAVVWGFSNLIIDEFDITFKKGSVSKKASWNIRQHQKVERLYNLGLIEIQFDGHTYRIYDPERTLVDLVKENIGHMSRDIAYAIRMFFHEINYDVEKLLMYARELKVENEIMMLLGVIHE